MNRSGFKSSAVLTIISILLASLMVFSFGCVKKEEKEIKIGAILPLTGDAAIYGQELKNGIDLALDEINTRGGIKGKLIKVIYEDDAGDAKGGVAAINKLIKIEKIPVIIGGAMSSVAMSIAPIAQNEKTVLLSPTATAPALSNTGKYFFRIWPSDNYDGQIMADFAFNKLNLRRISILYVNSDYGKGIEEVFGSEFKKYGGKVISSEGYELGTNDFRSQLTKIKSLSPDAIYLPGYYKELSGILRQVKELRIKSKLLSVNSFYDPKLINIAGNAAEGAIFTYPLYDVESEEPVIKEFVSKFNQRYGKNPDAFAVQGYDAMKILTYAIEKGGLTSDEIQKEMSQIRDFPGVSGKMSFDEHGDIVKGLKLLTVRNGKFAPFVE